MDVETCEPQTQELSVSSFADSLSLNFLVYLVEMSCYFSMKTKEKLENANWVKKCSCDFCKMYSAIANVSLQSVYLIENF